MGHEQAKPELSKKSSSRLHSIEAVTGSAKTILKKLPLGRSEELSWEELKAIEKRRRAILKRVELPFYRIITFWDGTCLRVLSQDPLMWLSIGIYSAVRVQARVGLPDSISELKTGDIGVLGAFLSFFLVFFVVQSNNRFNMLYGQSMVCKGRIFDAASLCASNLPEARSRRIIRYMNAAHVSAYVGLSDTYSCHNFFDEIDKRTKLLSDQEYARLAEIDIDAGGSPHRELIVWALREVHGVQEAGLVDSQLAMQLREQVLALRVAIGSLFNAADQPISFFYVHFICLLSALYLPLFALAAAYNAGVGDEAYWVTDVITGLIVFLQNVFVIGLRLLGQKMNDPYGSDVEDLSVMHYCNFTWLHSQRILAAHSPPPLDEDVESELCHEGEPIGDAWEGEVKVSRIMAGSYISVP